MAKTEEEFAEVDEEPAGVDERAVKLEEFARRQDELEQAEDEYVEKRAQILEEYSKEVGQLDERADCLRQETAAAIGQLEHEFEGKDFSPEIDDEIAPYLHDELESLESLYGGRHVVDTQRKGATYTLTLSGTGVDIFPGKKSRTGWMISRSIPDPLTLKWPDARGRERTEILSRSDLLAARHRPFKKSSWGLGFEVYLDVVKRATGWGPEDLYVVRVRIWVEHGDLRLRIITPENFDSVWKAASVRGNPLRRRLVYKMAGSAGWLPFIDKITFFPGPYDRDKLVNLTIRGHRLGRGGKFVVLDRQASKVLQEFDSENPPPRWRFHWRSGHIWIIVPAPHADPATFGLGVIVRGKKSNPEWGEYVSFPDDSGPLNDDDGVEKFFDSDVEI